MNYIAHRGKVNNSEDNSLESFINAFNDQNYIGIETDVRVSKDNVFILYHNTLFKGNLVKNTLYKEFKKEGICSLKELLKINTKKIIILEIKDFDLNVDNLLKLLNKYNRNIYIMSFNTKVIDKIYNKNTKYKVGILNYVINTPEVYKYNFVCILNDLLSDFIIDSYNGVEVIGYGVRNIKSIKYNNLKYIIDDKDLFYRNTY